MTSLRERADAAAQVLVDDLGALSLADADAHHLGRVLRLRDGEVVIATDGEGSWRMCSFAHGVLEPTGPVALEPPPASPVSVWLPALKGERAEWAVAKLTELGVDEIGLLVCDRAVVRLDAVTTTRVLDRWHRVVREAACQSRRVRLPVLAGPLAVPAIARDAARRCDLDGEPLGGDVTSLCVGPEGGWSDAERADDATVSLGETVLRTETAALVAGVMLTEARRARHADAGEAQ